jgi:hypothetical protein
MTRTAIILTLGAVSALFGIVLTLRVDDLATHWQALGPGTRGGTTNPATVRGYELIGLYLVAFGLALAVLAVQRWLAGGISTSNVRPAAGIPDARC